MSTQLAEIKEQALTNRQKSKPIELLIQASLKELGKTLPSHLKAERLVRIAITAIRQNPKLAECTPMSFLAALFQSAQLGLEPNIEGQAYITPYLNSKKIVDENGKTKWIKVLEAQFQIGYKGLIDLFYRHESAEHIDMHSVHENDKFNYQYGSDSYLYHTPVLKNRGDVIAYYAVAKIRDGGSVFKVMSKDSCIEHGKAHSKCFDKDTNSFDKNSPWFKYPNAMCKKTVLIQLAKLLPKSVELQKALSMDDTTKSRLDVDMFNIKDETNWDEDITIKTKLTKEKENTDE